MRKAILGVLILAAAGGIFAQELKFDGYFNSGLGIVSTNTKLPDGAGTKTADTRIVPFGVDSEQAGYRFRLNGSYTNENAAAGVKFRFQAQSKFDLGAFSLPYAYGWVSFLNNIFTVTGGLVDDGTWNSGGAILNDDTGEGLGALVKISPVSGLNLGVGMYVITPQGSGDNNTIIVPVGSAAAANDFSKFDIPLNRIKYTFNAGYTMEDIFKVTLSFRTKNQTGDAVSRYSDAGSEVFGSNETAKLMAGVQLLAVKNLTAVIEGEIDKLEDSGVDSEKDNLDFNLYETFGYKIGDLAFGLNAVQNFRPEKDVENDIGLHLNPWISYAFGPIVPRLDLNYYMAGTALTKSGTNQVPGAKYHRKVFAYANNKGADNLSVFAVRPSIKFNIVKNVSIEAGDLIAFATGPETSFADAEDSQKSSNLSNVFYIDFTWKF
jgi:hypothetical protein